MPSPRDDYHPIETRATVFLALMGAFLLASLASIASSFLQLGLLSEVAAGNDVPMERLEANDHREMLSAIAVGVAFLATGVSFLVWIRGASRNAHALESRPLKYSPGWAVGCFFVPILNLYRPYQTVREIWQASRISMDPVDTRYVPPVVGWWWCFWIVSNILGRISAATTEQAEGVVALRTATYVSIVESVLSMLAGALCVGVVRSIQSLQEAKSLAPASERGGAVCPMCGESIEADAAICAMCGEPITRKRPAFDFGE